MVFPFFGTVGEVSAVEVDAEVLLLVDVSKSVTDTELDGVLDGFAQVFESSAVLDAIQNGEAGSIAASMVFFSDKNSQAVGIGWMEISDAVSAQAFADALRGATRTSNKTNAALASAIDYSVPLFGVETGGVANGFESAQQMVTFAADSTDTSSPATGGQSREDVLAASSAGALVAGVDVINAITLGGGATLVDYYADHVIGGESGGQVAVVQEAPTVGDFAGVAQGVLGGGITAVVPEPRVIGLAGLGVLMLFSRRR